MDRGMVMKAMLDLNEARLLLLLKPPVASSVGAMLISLHSAQPIPDDGS